MKAVLPELIGEEQAAFVAARNIFDNILLSQALVKGYTRKHLSPRCLIKVDIRKAFDSLSWSFISMALAAYGFPPLFVEWVMTCLSTPYYTLKINGSTHGYFQGKKWIRQGDPIFPYIFVLSMEVLSRYLRDLPKIRDFSYHPKCVRINLTHLVFADDLMIYTRGDVPSVQAAVDALTVFANVSGLEANPSKTDIYLGGVRDDVRNNILMKSGFKEGEFPFRYLGIPLASANLRNDMYQHLLDMVKKYIAHWGNQYLSYAGRVQLINSMLFGVENFWCAALLLPKGVIKRVTRMCREFLWQVEEGKHRIILKSWREVCSPKTEGGFNIKEVLSWNKAMLCRQLADLLQGRDSIWIKWLCAYKLQRHDVSSVKVSSSDPESWKDVLSIRDELLQRLGKEKAVDFLSSWSGTKSYNVFRLVFPTVYWSPTVWSPINVPRHIFIAVLALQNKLPTVDNLRARGLIMINWCVLCKCHEESRDHLFFHCPIAKEVAQQLWLWLGFTRRVRSLCFEARFGKHLCKRAQGWKSLWFCCTLVAAIYHIWMERNRRIFTGEIKDVAQLVRLIKNEISLRMINCSSNGGGFEMIDALNG